MRAASLRIVAGRDRWRGRVGGISRRRRDEPSLGLAPRVVHELFVQLGELESAGGTLVLVEQNTRRTLELADHVYLMQGGKVVLSQPARETDLETLHRLYLAR